MAKFVDVTHKTTNQKIWINGDHVTHVEDEDGTDGTGCIIHLNSTTATGNHERIFAKESAGKVVAELDQITESVLSEIRDLIVVAALVVSDQVPNVTRKLAADELIAASKKLNLLP
jgi:hypothetical protein